jgi:hypothetical protein
MGFQFSSAFLCGSLAHVWASFQPEQRIRALKRKVKRRAYNTRMDCPEMELLKRDLLRGGDGRDCFVLSSDDEAEGRAAEEHILQWLAERELGHCVRRHGDSVYVSPLPLTADDWKEALASADAEDSIEP